MCGICGYIHHDRARPVPEDVVRAMTRILAHRGPDDHGLWTGPGVALGHARLSVIDTSTAGRQPLANEDGTVAVVANGEIYNYKDLKKRLEDRGHVFRSATDSEVLVHLWEDKGPDCVHDLAGMFAFAVWDAKTRTLFAARDRLGQKPLVYLAQGHRFVFASEIKGLLRIPDFTPEPDPGALHLYMAYQSVPAPWSAFEGVKKLPAGHTLTVKDGRVSVRRYWHRSYRNKIPPTTDFAETAGQVTHALSGAVSARLMSDVPLGAFLSGGIDSSLVAALMARHAHAPVSTFSIGFEHSEYDESAFARMVADHVGTRHHRFVVRPDAASLLPALVWQYDEPFADPAAIPTWYLSRLAREYVTVALCGDGGDESFGGYPRYFHGSAGRLADRLRRLVKKPAQLFHYTPAGQGLWANWRRLTDLSDDRLRYYLSITHVHEAFQDLLYTPDMKAATAGLSTVDLMLDAFRRSDARDFVDSLMDVDLEIYLPNTLMTKVDMASMAHALEVRSPFLDHRVVELAASLPAGWKLSPGGVSKHILKEAARPFLPAAVIDRPKMGFGVPLDHWFRGELKTLLQDVLLSPRAAGRGLLKRNEVEKLIARHMDDNGESWQYVLYNLLMLELWHLMFVDKTLAVPSTGGGLS